VKICFEKTGVYLGMRFQYVLWWRASTNSTEFFRCLNIHDCVGGHESSCSSHRTGPICATCEKGYRSTTGASGADCVRCPSKGESVGVTIVVIIVVVFALAVGYMYVIWSDKPLVLLLQKHEGWGKGRELQALDTKFDLAAASARDMGAKAGSSTLQLSGSDAPRSSDAGIMDDAPPATLDERELIEMEAMKEDDRIKAIEQKSMNAELHGQALAETSRNRPNFTYKLKILVGFLQVVTNLAFAVDVPWPRTYRAFINRFSFVNLDFVPWQSVGCVTLFNFYEKFLIVTFTPMGVLAALFFFFLLPLHWFISHDLRDDPTLRNRVKLLRHRFWKLVLVTVFLMYPGVSSIVMSFFICRTVAGVNYLLADFDLRCYDSEWQKHLPFAIIMLIIYPLGVPCITLFFLTRYRARFEEPGVRIRLGFLYDAYIKVMWWFELADMANKLFLTSIVAFFPVKAQMPIAMVWLVCYMILILRRFPYIRKGDDRLQLFALTEIFLVILTGFILVDLQLDENKTLSNSDDDLMSAVLITLTIALFIMFVVMAIRAVMKLIDYTRLKQLTAKNEEIERISRTFITDTLDTEEETATSPSAGEVDIEPADPLADPAAPNQNRKSVNEAEQVYYG